MADPSLPRGYLSIPATDDVLPAAADHVRSVFSAESGRPFFSVEDYVNLWNAPFIDRDADIALVATGQEIVAQAIVMNREPYSDAACFGAVSPDHYDRGLGTALLVWAEDRTRERIDDAPPGCRVVNQGYIDAHHQRSVRLLEDNGYAADRFFITMEVGLPKAPEPPVFPDGLEVRQFAPDQIEVAAAAVADAFRDHYGFVERPLAVRVEEIRRTMHRPDFDQTLWWLVWDGGQVVANCWCIGNNEGDESVGYVMSLGVRNPWRGRGIGRALLLLAFGEFYDRGRSRAALDADAHSLTGATRLYESVGMSEIHRNAAYIKELRPGTDLATRALD